MVTFSLIAVPIVLVTLHLYTNTPPVIIVLFQTPVVLVSFTIIPFTYNWYVWTARLLLAEQVKVTILPWQAVVLLGTSLTISGGTKLKIKVRTHFLSFFLSFFKSVWSKLVIDSQYSFPGSLSTTFTSGLSFLDLRCSQHIDTSTNYNLVITQLATTHLCPSKRGYTIKCLWLVVSATCPTRVSIWVKDISWATLRLRLTFYLSSRVRRKIRHNAPKTCRSTKLKCTRTLPDTDMYELGSNSWKDLEEDCKKRQWGVKFLVLFNVIIVFFIVLLTPVLLRWPLL